MTVSIQRVLISVSNKSGIHTPDTHKLTQARETAYHLAKDIQWEGGVHYQTDIGHTPLKN